MPANKPTQPSHLKDLILLFAIPIGIAVFAAMVVYVPSLFANPKSDFIYSSCSGHDCSNNFNIDGSGSISQYNTNRYNTTDVATLRYYDAESDSTRSISIDDAQRYQLDTSSKSPDGYTLTREQSDSGFLFWGDYESGWYLKNGAKKKQIELSTNGSYYYGDVKFLGWVNK